MSLARRQRLALELALLALVAYLAARSLGDAVDLAAASAPRPAAAPAPEPAPVPVAPLAAYEVIAERDIFNPGRGEGGPVAQRGALRLWGVGMHGGEARAVIEDGTTRRQELYRVGDAIAGGRVAAIDWDRVTLAVGDGETVLELEPPPTGGAAAEERAEPAAAPVRVSAEERIRRTGDDAWIVDRRALAGSDGMSGLLTQLRAVAEVRDGRPAGFRLFQIRQDSLFARLGLRDGDVVRRVNGAEIAEPAALLGFLDRLRSEPRVALDIVRGDRPRTLVYDLR